jgi:hypothetical protein
LVFHHHHHPSLIHFYQYPAQFLQLYQPHQPRRVLNILSCSQSRCAELLANCGFGCTCRHLFSSSLPFRVFNTSCPYCLHQQEQFTTIRTCLYRVPSSPYFIPQGLVVLWSIDSTRTRPLSHSGNGP